MNPSRTPESLSATADGPAGSRRAPQRWARPWVMLGPGYLGRKPRKSVQVCRRARRGPLACACPPAAAPQTAGETWVCNDFQGAHARCSPLCRSPACLLLRGPRCCGINLNTPLIRRAGTSCCPLSPWRAGPGRFTASGAPAEPRSCSALDERPGGRTPRVRAGHLPRPGALWLGQGGRGQRAASTPAVRRCEAGRRLSLQGARAPAQRRRSGYAGN
jgi:hypothetical protein